MLEAFIITLREGLEAFLIIAISLAYLRKTGREVLIPAIHWGIGVSILLSIGLGILFQRASNQALWEGVLAIAAAVLVMTLIVHMWRHAQRLCGGADAGARHRRLGEDRPARVSEAGGEGAELAQPARRQEVNTCVMKKDLCRSS